MVNSKIICTALLVFFFFNMQPVAAQFKYKKNAVFAEGFGNSKSLISVNYERMSPLVTKYLFFGLRTGVGFTPGIDINEKKVKGTVSFPGVFSIMAGGWGHYAQLGLGYTASFCEDYIDETTSPPTIYKKFESSYNLSLGYRYMDQNGLYIQAYPMLSWTNNPSERFKVWFGIGIGDNF